MAVSNHPTKFDKRTRRAYISNAGPVDSETLEVLTQPIPADAGELLACMCEAPNDQLPAHAWPTQRLRQCSRQAHVVGPDFWHPHADGKEGVVPGTAEYLENLDSVKFKSTTKIFGTFEGKKLSELLKSGCTVTGLLQSLRSSPSPSGHKRPNAGVYGCSHCLATDLTSWKCPLCERVVTARDQGGTKSDCILTLTKLYSRDLPVAETPANASSSSMASSSSIGPSDGGGRSRKRARGPGIHRANGRGGSNGGRLSSRQLAFDGNEDNNNYELSQELPEHCSGSQEEMLAVYAGIKANAGADAAALYMASGLDVVLANDKHRTPLPIDPAKVRDVDSVVLDRMHYAACAGAVTEQTLQKQRRYIFFAVDFARAHAAQAAGGAMPAPPLAAYPALRTIVGRCAADANVEQLLQNLADQGLTSTKLLQDYCHMCGENAMRDLCAGKIGMTGAEAAAVLALLRGRAG